MTVVKIAIIQEVDGLIRLGTDHPQRSVPSLLSTNHTQPTNKEVPSMSSMFNPENFVEGGGLLDDINVLFKETRIEMFDYNGKADAAAPCLRVTMEDDDGAEHLQYFSMGKASDWQPSEDGTTVIAVGKATGIANSSNAAQLIASIVNAGFPTNKITDDIRWLEGIRAHLSRVPAPKRGGLVKKPREDGRVFEDTILIVSEILQYPWDKKPAKGKPAGGTAPAAGKPATAGTKAPASAPPADVDIDSVCAETLLEILSEQGGGPIKKAQIAPLAMKKVKDKPYRNQVVATIFKDDFLKTQAGWTFENGEISLG